jgi:hypothetical protein
MTVRDDIRASIKPLPEHPFRHMELPPRVERKLLIIDPERNHLVILEVHQLDALLDYRRTGLESLTQLYAARGYAIVDKRKQPAEIPPLDALPKPAKRNSRKKSTRRAKPSIQKPAQPRPTRGRHPHLQG